MTLDDNALFHWRQRDVELSVGTTTNNQKKDCSKTEKHEKKSFENKCRYGVLILGQRMLEKNIWTDSLKMAFYVDNFSLTAFVFWLWWIYAYWQTISQIKWSKFRTNTKKGLFQKMLFLCSWWLKNLTSFSKHREVGVDVSFSKKLQLVFTEISFSFENVLLVWKKFALLEGILIKCWQFTNVALLRGTEQYYWFETSNRICGGNEDRWFKVWVLWSFELKILKNSLFPRIAWQEQLKFWTLRIQMY